MYYKSVLVNVILFALGAGIGFFAGKKIYEEYYAAIAQEEIDSVKETFGKYAKQDVENDLDENSDVTRTTNEFKIVSNRTANNPLTRSSLDGNPYEQAKRNYNLIGSIKHEEVVDNEDECDGPLVDAAGNTEEEMDLSKVDRTQPYIINDWEFSEEFDHHDKVSLYYYRVDDVLCDDHEEVIDNIEETVSYDALARLDMQTTVWVRNEPLSIDYEIISINKSFAETIHGIGIERNLSPREKYALQQRGREKRE